jgi:hypothetical protein
MPGGNHNDERIHVVYFERADGYVYVPADSSRVTPDGYERKEATTLKEIDRLTTKLNRQDQQQFDRIFEQDHAQLVEFHNRKRAILGQRLLAADCSPVERAFIRSAFAYFKRKEDEALKYTVRGYFHQREFDSVNAKIDDYGKQLTPPKLSDRLSSVLGIDK